MRILHVKSFTSIILILYNFPLPPNQTLRTHYQEVSQAYLQAVYFPVRVCNHACMQRAADQREQATQFQSRSEEGFSQKIASPAGNLTCLLDLSLSRK